MTGPQNKVTALDQFDPNPVRMALTGPALMRVIRHSHNFSFYGPVFVRSNATFYTVASEARELIRLPEVVAIRRVW